MTDCPETPIPDARCPICGHPLPCESCLRDLRNDP